MASGLLQAAGVETDADGMVMPGQGKGVKALKEASSPPEGHEGAGHGRFVDLLEGGGRKLGRDEAVQAVKKRLGLKYSAVQIHLRTNQHCAKLHVTCSPSRLVPVGPLRDSDDRHLRGQR
jgi:hypothetical protein